MLAWILIKQLKEITPEFIYIDVQLCNVQSILQGGFQLLLQIVLQDSVEKAENNWRRLSSLYQFELPHQPDFPTSMGFRRNPSVAFVARSDAEAVGLSPRIDPLSKIRSKKRLNF